MFRMLPVELNADMDFIVRVVNPNECVRKRVSACVRLSVRMCAAMYTRVFAPCVRVIIRCTFFAAVHLCMGKIRL